MNRVSLAYKSIRSRSSTAWLTVVSIAISIVLLLGVSRLNNSIEKGFTNSISETDLIVGASTGEEQLVLASVFHLGQLNNQVKWSTYEDLKRDKRIKWIFPVSFGDTHQGFDVIGTDETFFKHFKYGDKTALQFEMGESFNGLFDVVIGAKVAENKRYEINDELHLQHGSDAITHHTHHAHSFRVSGILKKTGTPLDNSLFIRQEALEGIHLNYVDGMPDEDLVFTKNEIKELELQPQAVSALFLGLKNRKELLSIQKSINTYSNQALTAASPSLTLVSLWSIMQKAQTTLSFITYFVVLSGLIGMLISLLTAIKARRREMAILRSLGASFKDIYTLIVGEAVLMTLFGIVIGLACLSGLTMILNPLFAKSYGIQLKYSLNIQELYTLSIILIAGTLIGTIPAHRMRKNSLKDGMSIKL